MESRRVSCSELDRALSCVAAWQRRAHYYLSARVLRRPDRHFSTAQNNTRFLHQGLADIYTYGLRQGGRIKLRPPDGKGRQRLGGARVGSLRGQRRGASDLLAATGNRRPSKVAISITKGGSHFEEAGLPVHTLTFKLC